jgi:hypothetical protein
MKTGFLRSLLAILFAAASAGADGADEAFVQKGLQLRREHRDEEALEEFRHAYEIRPSARTRAQLALAEQAVGRWLAAEKDLAAALADDADSWISAHADGLRAALATIQQHLGWLIVESTPGGAELLLNGESFGALPMAPVRVVAGPIDLEVRRVGRPTFRRTLDIPAGGTLTQRIDFVAERPVDARDLAASSAGPTTDRRSVARTAQRTAAWSAAGAGGAFLGAALGAQLIRWQKVSRYNDDSRCFFGDLSRDQRCGLYRAQGETAQTFADVGYVASGAFGLASAVLFLTLPRSPAAGRPSVVLDPSSGNVWLGWIGAL